MATVREEIQRILATTPTHKTAENTTLIPIGIFRRHLSVPDPNDPQKEIRNPNDHQALPHRSKGALAYIYLDGAFRTPTDDPHLVEYSDIQRRPVNSLYVDVKATVQQLRDVKAWQARELYTSLFNDLSNMLCRTEKGIDHVRFEILCHPVDGDVAREHGLASQQDVLRNWRKDPDNANIMQLITGRLTLEKVVQAMRDQHTPHRQRLRTMWAWMLQRNLNTSLPPPEAVTAGVTEPYKPALTYAVTEARVAAQRYIDRFGREKAVEDATAAVRPGATEFGGGPLETKASLVCAVILGWDRPSFVREAPHLIGLIKAHFWVV